MQKFLDHKTSVEDWDSVCVTYDIPDSGIVEAIGSIEEFAGHNCGCLGSLEDWFIRPT